MSLHAFDDIEDAFEAMKAFLLPFDLSRWAKLALVAFFIGGVGGSNPLQFSSNVPSGSSSQPAGDIGPGEAVPTIATPELAVIAAIVGVAIVLGVLFMLVGSIMEFVFLASIRNESVRIKSYWSTHWRKGVRLFAFRFLLGALVFGTIGLFIAAVFTSLLFGAGGFSIGAILLGIPVILGLGLGVGVVNKFTTDFVVPIMLLEDRGVLAAWRRLWPTLTAEWKEYLVYLVMAYVLGIAASFVTGIAMFVALIALGIVIGLLALVGLALLFAVPIAGFAVIGIAVVLFVLALLVVSAFVAVPIQTYFRYYALLVLGDTNREFELIAERRRAIRE